MKNWTHSGSLKQRLSHREEKHRALARRAAAEGIVLLKNEGLLPLKTSDPIALFGSGAEKTVKGGIGSGDVNNRENISVYKGIKEAGASVTNEDWIRDYDKRYKEAREEWKEKILEDARHVQNPFDAYAANPFVLPDGRRITEQDLNNGDVLNIYGNGIMAQSYPGQYNGISKIERTEQENQEYIEEYSHFLDEFFVEKEPSQRPELNVCYTDDLAAVTVMIPEALGYTWTYEENGEGNTITTDAPHILQTNPTEVTKLSEPMKMELMFDVKPESVQILSWEDSLLGQYQDRADQIPDGTPVEIQENEEGNPEFTAQPGCVYLVQGQWENGTADYGFCTPSE